MCTLSSVVSCPYAAAHFARQREPKVLVTTCFKPSKAMFTFLTEMLVSPLCLSGEGHGSGSLVK